MRDVDLSVQRGEVFVIMGLSGSGKSTLVRCMTGLVTPTLGRLLIDGTDLMNISASDLVQVRRYKMGMVFQDFALLPHLTVLGNVVFPLKIQGIERSARETRARAMIELVGLDGARTLVSARTLWRTAANVLASPEVSPLSPRSGSSTSRSRR